MVCFAPFLYFPGRGLAFVLNVGNLFEIILVFEGRDVWDFFGEIVNVDDEHQRLQNWSLRYSAGYISGLWLAFFEFWRVAFGLQDSFRAVGVVFLRGQCPRASGWVFCALLYQRLFWSQDTGFECHCIFSIQFAGIVRLWRGWAEGLLFVSYWNRVGCQRERESSFYRGVKPFEDEFFEEFWDVLQ